MAGTRVMSTLDQLLDIQFDVLKKFVCGKILTDVARGAKADRPATAVPQIYTR